MDIKTESYSIVSAFKALVLFLVLVSFTVPLATADFAPEIQWQKCLGGSGFDNPESIQQTSDGGYVVSGTSDSTDGNVTGNHGGKGDCWIVKLDTSGNIVWQKCLGGSSWDMAESIKQTSDGGYIVAGTSDSTDGNVTGNHGSFDWWIIKLDTSGNIIWQKCLGGSDTDDARSIQQTSDGGYVVSGISDSTDGNVTGNHGGYEGWIVKLDTSGNIVWQKCLGGSTNDDIISVQQTSDDGYIAAGYSQSKDGDVTGNHGGADFWIVKLDTSGNIVWQKCLGGSGAEYAESIQQTSDGGYIVAGITYSTNGNVTENHGDSDCWVIKLDTTGNKVWQKSYGGSDHDYALSIRQSSDKGYVIAGGSESNDGDMTENHGRSDFWIIKLNTTGNIVWQKCLGGSGSDDARSIQQTSDGGYIVAGILESVSYNGSSMGTSYFIVKFAPPAPVADFSASSLSGNAPLHVSFTDISTETPTTWLWNFGDGTNDSVNPNPEHIYTVPGIYNVSLTVTNANGTDSKSTTVTVSKEKTLPVLAAVNLSNNLTSGYAPLNVQIVGLLENATGVNWDFGDGNNSFANFTLEHLFSIPGTYNISINPTNENGTSSKVVTINVLKPPVLPVAKFNSNVTQGYAPLPTQFTDLSTNATELNWNFGDGTNSSEQNPMHTYSAAGNYTVNLTVANEDGINSGFSTITVLQKPVSSWEYSPKEPVCGDTLDVNGSASPRESINASITFEKTVNVSEGKFEYFLENVTIPNGLDNLFTVEARGVNSLNVGVKTVIWVTKSSRASGDTAILSQSNIPPGNYAIKINGDAEEGVSKVNLKITAFQHIKADSNGNFSYFYNTTGVPSGSFKVKIGDNTKEITLKPKELEQPSLVLPVANFSTNISKGNTPLSVQFTDLSENAAAWYWNFGDGTNSTEQNPKHNYYAAGNYTVNLTVTNDKESNSKFTTINVLGIRGPYAYITIKEFNAVYVIDTPTNNITAMVSVGRDPFGVAVSPDGTKVYATNGYDGTVSVIDTESNTVTATVGVGWLPEGVAVTPNGKKVYVANKYDNTVCVIDTTINSVAATVNVGNGPYGVAVSPDGRKVYVTNQNDNTISVIDAETNTVIATVNVGNVPYGVTVSPDGAKLYVMSDMVYVIDTETDNVKATINVGGYPTGVAVTPDGARVYVTELGIDKVSVIDTATNNVIATVNVGARPFGISITPDGTKVYVANNAGYGSFSVIDTATNAVISNVEVGGRPIAFGQFIGPLFLQPVLPVANFNMSISEGYAPLNVQFTDLSENATSVSWNFGDGTISAEANPIHIYSTPGDYIVNLSASNRNGTDSKLVTITALEQPILPLANFSSNVTQGYAPLLIQFTDNSKNTTGWYWNFGDEKTSVEQNPIHTYYVAGTYKANLTAFNENGTDSKSTTITIFKKQILPTANFSANISEDFAPLSVQFNDSSENAPSINWDFGDGTNSTEQNPKHTYYAAGNYTVNLTANNGENTDSKLATITVLKKPVPILPIANFTANITEGTAPLTVNFTDRSSGNPTEWEWNFGNGNTSTEQNPVNMFSSEGIYNVSLVATNGNGSSNKEAIIKVNPLPVRPVASFIAALNIPIKFTDTSSNSPTRWYWNFGDGSNSTEQSPAHIFSSDGIYNVTLVSTNAAGSSYVKSMNIKVNHALIPPVANFTSKQIGVLQVQFNDTSLNEVWERTWTFGDGSTSTDTNPTHIYDAAGTYVVNLTASNADGIDIISKTVDVNGTFLGPLKANFTAVPKTGRAPLTVNFTDKSVNATSITWRFGDNGAMSNESNPSHVYEKTGVYAVKLTATNGNVSDFAWQTISVNI